MGHLQNIQSSETSIETGNLQSYEEQSIGANSQFHNYKESCDNKSQFLINGLSKNSYTIYSDCLAGYSI